MNGTEALLLCILIMLVVLAAELGVIARMILRARPETSPEKAIREPPQAGQTINVNLSPLASVPVTAAVSATAPTLQAQPAPATEAVTEEEASGRENDRAPAPKPIVINAFAVKCPKCGSENSSYRTECFNCGSSL